MKLWGVNWDYIHVVADRLWLFVHDILEAAYFQELILVCFQIADHFRPSLQVAVHLLGVF